MNQRPEEEAELRRYLLGELPLERRVSVEERLFLDDDYTRLAQSVGDELVDEYAHQDLTGAERERFESHFLAPPEHRDDLRIARALKHYLDAETESGKTVTAVAVGPAPGHGGAPRHDKERGLSFFPSLFARRPAIGLSLAAALLVIISLVAWLAVRTMRRPDGGPPLQAQDPTPTQTAPPLQQRAPGRDLPSNGSSGGVETAEQRGGNQAPADVNAKPADEHAARHGGRPRNSSPAPRRPAPTGVATFTILPGVVGRGAGQTNEVSLTHDVGTVILKLPLGMPEDYDSYRATLRTGGRAKHTWPALKSETDDELGKVVSLKVPAGLLRAGSYEIKLEGLDADRQPRDGTPYSFTVDNK